MDDDFFGILSLGVTFGLCLFFGHIVYFRSLNKNNKGGSRQIQFMKFSLALIIIFIVVVYFNLDISDLSYVYLLGLWILTSYFIFHIFNLSQTGRRIRLLINILRHGSTRTSQEDGLTEVVERRINRLLEMEQIRETNDGYSIKSKTFLSIGLFLFHFKRLFFPKI